MGKWYRVRVRARVRVRVRNRARAREQCSSFFFFFFFFSRLSSLTWLPYAISSFVTNGVPYSQALHAFVASMQYEIRVAWEVEALSARLGPGSSSRDACT